MSAGRCGAERRRRSGWPEPSLTNTLRILPSTRVPAMVRAHLHPSLDLYQIAGGPILARSVYPHPSGGVRQFAGEHFGSAVVAGPTTSPRKIHGNNGKKKAPE